MRRRRQWLAVLLAGMMLAGSALPVYAQEEMLEAPVDSGSAQSAAASYALAAEDEEGWNGACLAVFSKCTQRDHTKSFSKYSGGLP